MRDAVGERVRLSRAGPGDDEERGAGRACLLPDAMLDGSSLFGIELVEIGDGHGLRIVPDSGCSKEACFSFVRNASLRQSQMWERQRLVVIVGQRRAMAIAVKSVAGRRRWTKLREWMTAPERT